MQSATDGAVQVLGDGLVTIENVDLVTMVLNGPHASRPATITESEAPPKNANTKAFMDGYTPVSMLEAAGSV